MVIHAREKPGQGPRLILLLFSSPTGWHIVFAMRSGDLRDVQ
jgi:hypothetical protein